MEIINSIVASVHDDFFADSILLAKYRHSHPNHKPHVLIINDSKRDDFFTFISCWLTSIQNFFPPFFCTFTARSKWEIAIFTNMKRITARRASKCLSKIIKRVSEKKFSFFFVAFMEIDWNLPSSPDTWQRREVCCCVLEWKI